MKQLIIPLLALLLVSCGSGSSEPTSENSTERSSSGSSIPTKQDVIDAMNRQYNMEGTSPGSPRKSIELHDVKIGTTDEPNEQDLIDGIPDKSKVTMAKIEYTHRTHYNEITKAYRETGTFKVYRDNFGEWIAMRDGTVGTKYFDEPADP
jgi:PBP1b-binding outer membrane lipoprotein LpoB